MKILTSYLSTMPTVDQVAFAARCGQKLGYVLCLRIAAESRGAIRPEDLRDDVDWDYLRAALAGPAQAATETVANCDCTAMRNMLTTQRDRAADRVAADPSDRLSALILENRNDALAELASPPASTAQAATETVAGGE